MDQWIDVELHCHTVHSKDCLVEVRDLLRKAREVGLQRLAVTDHNTIDGALEAKAIDPDLVIIGEEILTSRGELMAFFVTKKIPKGLEPLEAISRLCDQGAFISVSHPFDQRRHGWQLGDLEQIIKHVDAVEVFNSRCQIGSLNDQAKAFAEKYNLAVTVGSDAHTLREIGRSKLRLPYFNSAGDLRNVIRHGIPITQLSSPFIHLTSTFARIVKQIKASHENSPDRSNQTK